MNVSQITQAVERTPIVAVQNAYSASSGGGGQLVKITHAEVDDPEAVLELCAARGIAYLPFFPLAVGQAGAEKPALVAVAERHGATVAQIAIAWLLARSKVMLPIPGTGSIAHLEENWAARRIALSPADMAAIAAG